MSSALPTVHWAVSEKLVDWSHLTQRAPYLPPLKRRRPNVWLFQVTPSDPEMPFPPRWRLLSQASQNGLDAPEAM